MRCHHIPAESGEPGGEPARQKLSSSILILGRVPGNKVLVLSSNTPEGNRNNHTPQASTPLLIKNTLFTKLILMALHGKDFDDHQN